MDGVGIDVERHLAREVAFARQRQRQRGESGIDAAGERVGGDRAIGLDEPGFGRRLRAGADRATRRAAAAASRGVCNACQRLKLSLSRASSVSRSASARSSSTRTGAENPRRNDSAGRRLRPAKAIERRSPSRTNTPVSSSRALASVDASGTSPSSRVDEAERDRHRHRRLVGLAGRRRERLRDVDAEGPPPPRPIACARSEPACRPANTRA